MALPVNGVDKIIYKIKLNLGRGFNVTNINDLAPEWLNDAQDWICRAGNWWFMRAFSTINYTQGDGEENLPSDFKDEIEFSVYANSDYTPLDDMSEIDYVKFFDDLTQGTPTHYLIRESSLVLRPLPNAATAIKAHYYKYLADLVAGGSTNILVDEWDKLLEYKGTQFGFEFLEELTSAGRYEQLAENELKSLERTNAERVLPKNITIRAKPGAKASILKPFRRHRGRSW